MTKLNLLKLGCILLISGSVFAMLVQSESGVNVLSQDEMNCYYGGAIIDSVGGDCTECLTKKCSDIECSHAIVTINGDEMLMNIKGKNGDSDEVTGCYDSNGSSKTCTPGTSLSANCTVDAWYIGEGDEFDCSSTSPDYSDVDNFGGYSCS